MFSQKAKGENAFPGNIGSIRFFNQNIPVDGLLKKIIQFPNFLGVFPRKVPFHSQSFPNFRSIMFEWKETQDFTYRWISGGKEDGKRRWEINVLISYGDENTAASTTQLTVQHGI